MNWYYAIQGTQKGPVPADEFERLIADGTVGPETMVWHEGLSGWLPLREARPAAAAPPPVLEDVSRAGSSAGARPCSECGGRFPEDELVNFGERTVCAACKPVFLQRMAEGAPDGRSAGGRSVEEVLAQKYEVNIGRHWSRAWTAFGARPGFALGAFVVGNLLMVLVSMIPLVSIFAVLVQGPMLAGLWLVMLRLIRSQPAELGQLFDGFRRGFWQLVLVQLVQGVLMAAIVLPLVALGAVPIILAAVAAQQSGQPPFSGVGAPLIGISVAAGLAALGVAMVAGITWMFALPLVADRRMDFWPAMELSRKLAWRRFGGLFLFAVVIGLVNLGGMLVLCLGWLVSGPVTLLMMASLFDELAGDLRADPA